MTAGNRYTRLAYDTMFVTWEEHLVSYHVLVGEFRFIFSIKVPFVILLSQIELNFVNIGHGLQLIFAQFFVVLIHQCVETNVVVTLAIVSD